VGKLVSIKPGSSPVPSVVKHTKIEISGSSPESVG